MSAPLQNDLFLRALLRQPTPRTPLWMMRQAGRYLPEYRATRTKAGSFLNLCMNPELACEVTRELDQGGRADLVPGRLSDAQPARRPAPEPEPRLGA